MLISWTQTARRTRAAQSPELARAEAEVGGAEDSTMAGRFAPLSDGRVCALQLHLWPVLRPDRALPTSLSLIILVKS